MYVTFPPDGDTAWGDRGRTVFASIPGLELGAGGTSNDTSAVAAAMAAVSSGGGGAVIGRPGVTYKLLDCAWPSNVGIIGNGCTFQMVAGTSDNHTMFSATGTSTATSGNVQNIWARDCMFLGTVATDAFVQHRHLLVLGGVSDGTFQRCKFVGFQGDGAYLGHIGGNERHNERIKFVGCLFDGVNQDNRNAISVIDCDDLLIDGNSFLNTTRTDMPAAIDIEPNSGNTWSVVRNTRIVHNGFKNIRAGIAGVVAMVNQVAQASLTTPMTGLVIAGNTFVDCPSANASVFLSQAQSPSATTRRNEIVVANNVAYNSGKPAELAGVRGVTFRGNAWENCWNGSDLGYSNPIRDVLIDGDTYQTVAGSNGIQIYRVTGLTIANCDWDAAGSGQVLRMVANTGAGTSTGVSDQVDFINNRIKGTGPSAVVLKDSGHTVTSTANNRAMGNRFNGLSTSGVAAVFGVTANNL